MRRVRPVHTRHAARIGDEGLEPGNRNSRCIGGDDDIGGNQRVDGAIDFRLDGDVFGDVLDHQFGPRHGLGNITGKPDGPGALLRRRDTKPVQHTVNGAEHRPAAFDCCFIHVMGRHIDAAARQPRRDAGAHGAKPDECGPADHTVAALNASRAANAAIQRSRLGSGVRSILKSRQRFMMGASAMSAMVSLPSAR